MLFRSDVQDTQEGKAILGDTKALNAILRVEERIVNYVKFWGHGTDNNNNTQIRCIAGTEEPILSRLQQTIYDSSKGEFTIVNLQGERTPKKNLMWPYSRSVTLSSPTLWATWACTRQICLPLIWMAFQLEHFVADSGDSREVEKVSSCIEE